MPHHKNTNTQEIKDIKTDLLKMVLPYTQAIILSAGKKKFSYKANPDQTEIT